MKFVLESQSNINTSQYFHKHQGFIPHKIRNMLPLFPKNPNPLIHIIDKLFKNNDLDFHI